MTLTVAATRSAALAAILPAGFSLRHCRKHISGMGAEEREEVAAHAHLPHRGAETVVVSGGPPAGTFSWSAVACRGIVLLVWGITPAAWLYVAWSAGATSAFAKTIPLPLPLPPASGRGHILHSSILAYAVIECLFSIYYAWLVRKIQRKVDLPRYNHAFLRQTLARALEDGMKMEDSATIEQHTTAQRQRSRSLGIRERRPTFSRANFSRLSFMERNDPLTKDDPRAIDFRIQFSQWFLGTPWEELKRQNILEWLAWSFYGMSLEEIIEEWKKEGKPKLPLQLAEVDSIFHESDEDDLWTGKLAFCYHGLYMVETRAGMTAPEGRSNARSIRLHLDPVRATSRPLIKYLVTGFFNLLIRSSTKRFGYKHVHDGGLEYLIRMPPNWKIDGTEATRPMIFIHGLGMGLAQYASCLSYFEQHPALKARPVILLLQPHLSMNLFHSGHLKPPTKNETTAGLRHLVKRWHFEDGITVLSHSNGTIVAAWLLKDCPDLVKRSCLVDPVTFCLWEPHVAYNFLYRPPKSGIEILMRYFVGEEIGIALMLQRHFDWSANILWCEEIPNVTEPHSTMFFLAENDSILNAKRTARYLRDHGARYTEDGGNIRYLPGYAHGECLIAGGPTMVEIMDWVTHEREEQTEPKHGRPRVNTGYFGLPKGQPAAYSPLTAFSPLGPLNRTSLYTHLESFEMQKKDDLPSL